MFIKKEKDSSKLIDNVFAIASRAKQAKMEYGFDKVIDSTLGSLYDEDSKLVALDTVYNSYRNLSNVDYAKYASSISGNPEYKDAIRRFVIGDSFKILKDRVVATAGGTGAISITVANMLSEGETMLIPNIGWPSYSIIAKENNLIVETYEMFDKSNNFNLNNLKEKILESIKKQDKALVIINSPLHNPTGYSLSDEEWIELVRFINEDCFNKEVILLNDVAYIDYSFNLNNVKKYFSILDNLNSNCLLVIAYSCSKAFTSYGMRLGAAFILHRNEEVLEKVFNVYNKSCRAYWSNCNNSCMTAISNLINDNLSTFLNEKEKYVNLLEERGRIVFLEAKENGLEIYPFKEGFFITLKVDNSIRDRYHEELMNNGIFTVKVNNGIRIAICSLPIKKCYGLAKRLKIILDSIKD